MEIYTCLPLLYPGFFTEPIQLSPSLPYTGYLIFCKAACRVYEVKNETHMLTFNKENGFVQQKDEKRAEAIFFIRPVIIP